uniref:Maternal effect embryo arrest 59 n=1 Tax=Oryza nivara TaxID=4536 RepID=A0A0E0GKC1_ORYNI
MSRPARSDAHLSPEGEAAMEAEVREYYDEAAPKRHSKPSRSEPSAVYTDALVPDDSHPELDRFQQLEAHTEKLVCEGGKAGDEFVETEYYKDLGCVGKQHHTTGTGFIKMDKPSADASFHLSDDPDASERHASCKGNPATNEWIPSADTVYPASDKPNRSHDRGGWRRSKEFAGSQEHAPDNTTMSTRTYAGILTRD